MIGKIVSKLIQSLPSWEVTKYYGRVCIYQLKCLKYKVQTSEAWFNFKCKFMPGSLRNELECEEPVETKDKSECKEHKTQQQPCGKIENKSSHKYQNNKCSASSLRDTCYNQFVSKSKKEDNNNCHNNNQGYPINDEYMQKKQRKVKRAQ